MDNLKRIFSIIFVSLLIFIMYCLTWSNFTFVKRKVNHQEIIINNSVIVSKNINYSVRKPATSKKPFGTPAKNNISQTRFRTFSKINISLINFLKLNEELRKQRTELKKYHEKLHITNGKSHKWYNTKKPKINKNVPYENTRKEETQKKQSSPKIILMYNPLYWWEEWAGGTWETSAVFKNCPVSNCILSKNTSLFNTSDAVIFKLQTFNEPPRPKRRGQVWIFAKFEPPPILHHPGNYQKYRYLVNWTLSYRRDSDFTVTHAELKPYSQPNPIMFNNILSSKNKTAVIFNSHCPTQSRREQLVRLLNTSVDVDVFGLCGKLRCGGGYRFSDAWNMRNKTTNEYDVCFSLLDTKYKFYLSFENSLCRDYVTEKGTDTIFKHLIVPVVWGGVYYEHYLPPGSYIDARSPHLSTYKNVAALMKFLDANDEFFLKYFEWRKQYKPLGMVESWNRAFCKMCARLQNPEKYKRLYGDIYKWIYSDGHRNICYDPVV